MARVPRFDCRAWTQAQAENGSHQYQRWKTSYAHLRSVSAQHLEMEAGFGSAKRLGANQRTCRIRLPARRPFPPRQGRHAFALRCNIAVMQAVALGYLEKNKPDRMRNLVHRPPPLAFIDHSASSKAHYDAFNTRTRTQGSLNCISCCRCA